MTLRWSTVHWVRAPRWLVATILVAVPLSGAPAGQDAHRDTVRIVLADAERLFAQNNLQLLAARCNIDAAKAAIVQAQLWNNPTIAVEQNIYNQQTKRYFDVTKDGNTEVAIQQLFLLAGKRDKQVRLAEINARISEHAFADLLRSLMYQLRTNFYDLYFIQQSLRFYDESIGSLRKTVAAIEAVYEERSILLSEVLRLKSLLFSLQNERLSLASRATAAEGILRILLRDSALAGASLEPRVEQVKMDSVRLDTLTLERVTSVAREYRPEIKTVAAAVEYDQTNFALQKALSVPDVTVGGRWSRAGSYIPDYFAVSVSVDLPLFNRNQGNIEVSERTLESDILTQENTISAVDRDIVTAYRKAIDTDRLFRGLDRTFAAEYRSLADGMIANYEKRNISIIEFTDFYESYRNSVLQMNQLQNDRMDALEGLNYAIGMTLIHP
jgi:cobalt-zinc-cadmium efflux system outer membrane protein